MRSSVSFSFKFGWEALSKMVEKAHELGIFKGVELRKGSQRLTHLQYANDNIVLLHNDPDSIRGVKRVL